MCKAIELEQNPDRLHPNVLLPKKGQSWSMPLFGGIFNVFEFIFSLGVFVHESRKEKGMHLPTKEQAVEFFMALFLPFVSLYKIYTSVVIDPKQKDKTINLLMTTVYATCYIGWIIFFCFGFINNGFVALAWSLFVTNACILTALRMRFRDNLGIRGNMTSDLFASSFFYPQALAQMVIELNSDNVSAIDAGKHDD